MLVSWQVLINVLEKEAGMPENFDASVHVFAPSHARIKELAEDYCMRIQGLEGAGNMEAVRAYNKGWLEGAARQCLEEVVAEHQNDGENVAPLLAEIAFHKAVCELYRISGGFALAEKLDFLPPKS